MAAQPINDGGPAFPCEGGSDSGLHPASGMSLRDWLAGRALGRLEPPTVYIGKQETEESHRDYARRAYAIADAMLAERARQK